MMWFLVFVLAIGVFIAAVALYQSHKRKKRLERHKQRSSSGRPTTRPSESPEEHGVGSR